MSDMYVTRCIRRYHYNTSPLIVSIRAGALKWADGALLNAELERQVTALLGPKTEADLAPKVKEKKKKVLPCGGVSCLGCGLYCQHVSWHVCCVAAVHECA